MLPSEIPAKYGSNRGAAVLDKATDLIFGLIERHGVVCDHERPGFVHAGFGNTFLESWVREWGELGVTVERYDHQGLRDMIGTDFYHPGMREPRSGHLQPLYYTRGMAHTALEKGAMVYGRTRATSIHQEGKG